MGFSAHGVRIGIRINRPFIPSDFASGLPFGSRTLPRGSYVDHLYSVLFQDAQQSGRVRRFHLVYSGSALAGRSFDSGVVIASLLSDVHRVVAEFSRRELFVHAGVVGWKGGAILVPGKSFSGKSTLISELVRAGASYYSDEYAVLDRQGRVHPYSLPVSLRDQNGLPHRQIPLAELTAHAPAPPLRVQTIVLTTFKAGGRWHPRRLTPGATVLGLLSHTVQARTRPERALRTLRNVAARCTTLKGVRGEARETARMLLDL